MLPEVSGKCRMQSMDMGALEQLLDQECVFGHEFLCGIGFWNA